MSSSTVAQPITDNGIVNNNLQIQEQSNMNFSALLLRTTPWSSFQNVFQGVRRPSLQIHNLRTWMPRPVTFRYVPVSHVAQIGRTNNQSASGENNSSEVLEQDQGHSHHHHHHHHHNHNRQGNGNVQQHHHHHHIQEPIPPRRTALQERVANLQRNDPPDLLPNERSNNDRNGGGDDSNDDSVAEIFAQVPEARRAMNMLLRYVPFVCILLAKSTYDHIRGLTDLFILSVIFLHSNSLLRDQIANQTSRSVLLLLREFLYIFAIVLLRFLFVDEQTLYGLFLINLNWTTDQIEKTISLSPLLFSVAVTDLLLKLATIVVKIFITILPPNIIKYKRRGRIYALIEGFSQLYRALAPIELWLLFLLDSYTGMEKALGVLFSAVYIVSKAIDIYERGKFFRKAFINFQKKVSYGREPTREELQTAGQCPICHDNFDTPVILECNHVFCELCVGTWFTREQTCPLCRAKVADDPSWQDGATTFFVQLY
ncbi:RING finger and transmembrane domain-containing protein 2 isoform X2 [Condylostylus longicornis]|nr:RING finger and transmembrane domain-containing protein 2 isoform X2 [Condylostylus longicornis]